MIGLGVDLEWWDHIISIFSGLIMGGIGAYTAYLTIWCKHIDIIGYKKIDYSGGKPYFKFAIQVYNSSLSPLCISSLHLIFSEDSFLTVKQFDPPRVIQARTVQRIESDGISESNYNFTSKVVFNKPIYLLALTNKGTSVTSHGCSGWLNKILSYIKSYKWEHEKNYKQLHPIVYTSYDEDSIVCCRITSSIFDDKNLPTTVIQQKFDISFDKRDK